MVSDLLLSLPQFNDFLSAMCHYPAWLWSAAHWEHHGHTDEASHRQAHKTLGVVLICLSSARNQCCKDEEKEGKKGFVERLPLVLVFQNEALLKM